MTTKDLDLPAIESAARNATRGEWRWDPDDESFGSLQDGSHHITFAYGHDREGRPAIDIRPEDARHIATASPDVVLTMVARIRALEAGLGEALARWAADSGCGHTDDADFEMGAEYAALRSLLPSDAGKERT